jgi:hypothetical protein
MLSSFGYPVNIVYPFQMKTLFLTILLSFSAAACAQSGCPSVRGAVIDSLSMEACSYVRIYNPSKQQGVLAEYNGRFEICADQTDQLTISSPGYKSRIVSAAALHSGDSLVLLQPEGNVLDEVIILADDRHLYRWMDQVFAQKLPDHTAKTYMEVETFLDGTQVELVEAYYNGTIRGGDVRALAFKNGRMALSRSGNTSFLSTETSKAILQLRLNSGDDNLPDSPFEYSIKKMRKGFKLSLHQTYRSSRGHAVYIISFEPRQPETNAFSGTIWLDTVTKTALKLTLHAKPAGIHPFEPLFPDDHIVAVDLDLTYHFDEQSDEQQLDFIYFNYAMIYRNRDHDQYNVETNVIVHPYSYTSTFVPPYFKGHETRHSDYRRIQAFPYNPVFWNREAHPISGEIRESNEQFFNHRDVVYNSDSLSTFRFNNSEHGFFESPYRFWSPKRIVIVNTLADQQTDKSVYSAQPPARSYQLTARIYVDINFYDGKPHFLTATVLDPYDTFYRLPLDSTTNCFLNLYLDIVETERRKFENVINDPSFPVGQLDAAYAKLQTDVDAITQQFFRDVDHGHARKGMEKWNAYVLLELGIDNFRAFRLYADEP